MKDDTAIKFRRYAVYTLIIVVWTVLLAFATRFFWAIKDAKDYFQVP